MATNETEATRNDVEAPLVSIVVTTYNHEDFIEECLLSIAAQECDFPIEVLVGEDCATDGTRAVLEKLEPSLPPYFKIFYRPENMGDGGDNNSADLVNRCTGKYLATCEGDDFWTYPRKLQEQVDFLEGNPDYVACFHHCTVVGADSQPNGEHYPDCLDEEYSFDEYFLSTMPGQLASFIVRREPYLREKVRFEELRRYDSYASDRRNAFILLTLGKVRVFQESWSAYRHVTEGGTSHSATISHDLAFAQNEVNFGKTLVDYALRYGNEEAIRCALATCYRMRFRWCHGRNKVESLADILADISKEERPLPYLFSWARWYGTLGMRVLSGRSIML